MSTNSFGIPVNHEHELDISLIRETIGFFPSDNDPAMEAWNALSIEEQQIRLGETIEKTRPLIKNLLDPIPQEFLITNKNPLH